MEIDLDSSFENLECFNANGFEENSLLNELYEELYSKSRLSFSQFDHTEEDDRSSSVDSDRQSDSEKADTSEKHKEEENMQKSGIPTRSSPCNIPKRESSPTDGMASGERSSPSGIPVRKNSSGIPTRSPSASPTMIPRGIPRKGSTSSSGSSTRNSGRNSREDSPSGIPTRGSPRMSRDSDDDVKAGSPRRSSSGIPTRTSSGIPTRTPPGSPRTSGNFSSGIPTRGSPVLSGIPRKSSRTEVSGSYDSDDSSQLACSPRTSAFHTEEHAASEFELEQQKDSPSKIPTGIPMRTSRFSSPSHSRNQSSVAEGDGASEKEYRAFATGLPVKDRGVTSNPGASTPKHQFSREAGEDGVENMDIEQSEVQPAESVDVDSDGGSQSGDSQMQSSVIIHSSCSEDEDPRSGGSSLLYGKPDEKMPREDYSLLSRSKPAPVDQEDDQCVPKAQIVDISNDDTYEERFEEKARKDDIPKKTSPLAGYVYRPYGEDVEDQPALTINEELVEECPPRPGNEAELIDQKTTIDNIDESKTERMIESTRDNVNEKTPVMEHFHETDHEEITQSQTGVATTKDANEFPIDRMQTSTLSSMFDSTDTYKSNGEEFDAMVRANMSESMTESLAKCEPDMEKIKEIVSDKDIDISYENKTIIMKVGDIIGDNLEELNLQAKVTSPTADPDVKVAQAEVKVENIEDQRIPDKEPVESEDEEDGKIEPELKHVYLKDEFRGSKEIKEDIAETKVLVQTEREEMYMEKSDDEENISATGVEVDGITEEKQVQMADTTFEEVIERRKQIEIKPSGTKEVGPTAKVAEQDYGLLSRVRPAPVESSAPQLGTDYTESANDEIFVEVDDKPKKKYGQNIMERRKLIESQISSEEKTHDFSRRESSEYNAENVIETRKQVEIKSQVHDEQMIRKPLDPWSRDVFEPKNIEAPSNDIQRASQVQNNDIVPKPVREATKQTDEELKKDNDGVDEARSFHNMNPAGIKELESMYQEFESQVDDFLCFAESNLRGATGDADDGGHHEVLRGKNISILKLL